MDCVNPSLNYIRDRKIRERNARLKHINDNIAPTMFNYFLDMHPITAVLLAYPLAKMTQNPGAWSRKQWGITGLWRGFHELKIEPEFFEKFIYMMFIEERRSNPICAAISATCKYAFVSWEQLVTKGAIDSNGWYSEQAAKRVRSIFENEIGQDKLSYIEACFWAWAFDLRDYHNNGNFQ